MVFGATSSDSRVQTNHTEAAFTSQSCNKSTVWLPLKGRYGDFVVVIQTLIY